MFGDVPTPAATFLHDSNELTALLTAVVAIVLAVVVDRALLHRGHALATAVVREELTPMLDTRLRFLRRLVTLAILIVGLLLSLSQFGGLDRVAAAVLASGALLAAIVGFAARQTLANLIAGVMLTIAQPLRIGDSVAIEDERGTVEDVRLNYTVVRSVDGGRVFIPNERLAAGVLRNETIVDPLVTLEVDLWLPRDVDADQALAALAALDGEPVVRVVEISLDGVRYTVQGAAIAPAARPEQAALLRADALRALREAGLLSATD
jgi:small-conductance mechanosensitive channel